MGRRALGPCEKHGKKKCWECDLERYRGYGQQRRVRLMEQEDPPEPVEAEPKPICGCGRDYLQVPLDEPHQKCPNPIWPDQDVPYEKDDAAA